MKIFDEKDEDKLKYLHAELVHLTNLYNKQKNSDISYKQLSHTRNKILGINKQIEKLKSINFISESILTYLKN